MKYQDIHLADKSLWRQYQQYMQVGQTAQALALLENAQLADKGMTADVFNGLTTEMVRLENQGKDSTWSKSVIPMDFVAPSGLTSGQMYFKIANVAYWQLKPINLLTAPSSGSGSLFHLLGVAYPVWTYIDVTQEQISVSTETGIRRYYLKTLRYGNNVICAQYFDYDNNKVISSSYEGSNRIQFQGETSTNMQAWLDANATFIVQ